MILRALGKRAQQAVDPDNSAWHFVEHAQQHANPPLLLLPQPAHAVLSGEIARALLPSTFGELPANIIQAIRMHDTGWGILDAAQIHRLRGGDKGKQSQGNKQGAATVPASSFIKSPPVDAVAAWKASIDETQKIAPECGYIVSQHFSLLTLPNDPLHSAFRNQENARRENILKNTSLKPADLERWIDALGFCDLISLVLCSGEPADVWLPKVHPARDSATPDLHMRIAGDEVFLKEPLIPTGTQVEIHGLLHPAPQAGSAALCLRWTFA